MIKEKNKIYSRSLSYYAWKRLKRNKLAMAGLIFILFVTIVAILGYLIMPDSTPYANDQILELAIKKPGFKVKMLLVRKNKHIEERNIFYKMLFGQENQYKEIPISDYRFEGTNIIVSRYNNKSEEITFNIADVVYPIDYQDKYYDVSEKGYLAFSVLDNGKILKSIEELRKEIIKNNIITKVFIFGTDRYGRDMLSRLISGARISLAVGFISVFISLIIGVLLGSLGGYFRGKVDDIIMWLINVVWSVPTLLLVIAMTFALGKGFWQVFIAVGLTMWVEVARVVRGEILKIREKEFIEAGKSLGFSNFRIISKHILPNVMSPVIIISAANFASAILIEAGLSYLGIGAQPPQATWGKMISEHQGYIITGDAYLAILPGICIMLMVLAFLLVGNGLRDALDSKLTEEIQATVS